MTEQTTTRTLGNRERAVVLAASDGDERTRNEMALALGGLVAAHGGTVVAQVFGESLDKTWGTEHAVWMAASVPARRVQLLRAGVATVAEAFEQEAIAMTVGQVELVGGGAPVVRR